MRGYHTPLSEFFWEFILLVAALGVCGWVRADKRDVRNICHMWTCPPAPWLPGSALFDCVFASPNHFTELANWDRGLRARRGGKAL